jgi:repressor LexA
MNAPVTPKEEKLYRFIESFQLKNGKSPTVCEMRKHMGLKSDGFIVYLMSTLKKKGLIQKDDTPRGIKLLDSVREKLESDLVQIPVLGYVPAGGPVMTEEYVDDWVGLDSRTIKKPKETYMLKVKGDSMIDAGIFDGDYVLVHGGSTVRKGDIVVGLVDNANTVKRYMKDKEGRAYLKPENPEYENIYPTGELAVQGKVIGLFRWY